MNLNELLHITDFIVSLCALQDLRVSFHVDGSVLFSVRMNISSRELGHPIQAVLDPNYGPESKNMDG